MKVIDLMVGDWFHNNYTNENYQVWPRFFSQATNFGKRLDATFEDFNIAPIPLNPEILEKNEFKKFDFLHIEGQYQWTWWENTLISVTLWCRELNNDTKDGMVLKIEAPNFQLCIKVNYVHELQHALRLCGIEKEIIL